MTTEEESNMDRKAKVQNLAANAGKAAKGILGHAIQAVDQNEDGKFDLKDVGVIAGVLGEAAKKGAQNVKASAEALAKAQELKALRPIFVDEDFTIPKFIRLTERDQKHAQSPLCQGSIGYRSTPKGIPLVNLFRDCLDQFPLTFYPDHDGEFYYLDPSIPNRYIALDEYFSYLKIARVNELQTIAQTLGARHFRVTYKEEQASLTNQKRQAKLDAKANVYAHAAGTYEHHATERKFSTVEVAAEMSFPGHAPIAPCPVYLLKEPSIQSLIAMRLDENAPLLHQKYMLKLSNTSGIKEHDAAKIDAVLNGLKCSGNTTVSSEVKNESRRYLEYEIEF